MTLTTPDAPDRSSSHPAPVRRAVILAAGQGNRLQPLTDDVPKCLVEVGGEPLLVRSLNSLASHGVEETVIVVGYRADVVRDLIGDRFAGMQIRYVEASEYETTNNLRSLWDARDYLDQDVLLLEADLAFDPELVGALLAHPGSSAAGGAGPPAPPPPVVRRDHHHQVTSFILGADQGPAFDSSDAFKTVNIYLLREQLLREQIVPRLDHAIEVGRVHDYYETIFRDAVEDDSWPDLAAIDVSACRWYEIDDQRDLDTAEFLFLEREAQFDRIQGLHGSYWRYGFTDHSYLYNMHFPPPAMLKAFHDDLPDLVTNYPVGQNEVARLLSGWNGANPDHLAVANGASELIKVLGAHFATHLTIPTPSFNEYEAVVDDASLNRFDLTSGSFDLDTNAFADSAIAWQSDAAVVVSPNNPTARSVPREELLALARRLEPAGCRLIVDESFIEFSRSGLAASVEPYIEEHPNLVVIKSLSKVFGIAGLRIGYLLSADRNFIEAVRGALPIWNINGFAEEFLRTVGRYRGEFEESCELTRSTCQQLYRDLRALDGIEPLESDANFILARLTGPHTGPEFTRRLYVRHNILIKDCANKSMPDADRYLRIASRTPEENRILVDALASLL